MSQVLVSCAGGGGADSVIGEARTRGFVRFVWGGDRSVAFWVVSPHLKWMAKRSLQGVGVSLAFSLTVRAERSPEGNLRGSSTEWGSRLWLLGVSGFHGLRRDWVPNLTDCWPLSLRLRSGGRASV